MKVTSYAVARPAYYDRDAVSTMGSYDLGGITPHSETIRITTTVASGKKLLIETMYLSFRRQGAATTSGGITVASYAIGATSSAVMPRIDGTSNTINLAFTIVSQSFTIFAAERLDIQTSDFSTGGTMAFSLGFKGVTFNA